MLNVILFLVLVFTFYWFWRRYSFFEKFGIEYDRPLYFFGSYMEVMFQQSNLVDHVEFLYKSFKSDIVGIFDTVNPVFLLRSPALIKELVLNRSECFENRRASFTAHNGGLYGKSLFYMELERWKPMRAALIPSFTNTKMKTLFELINNNCKNVVSHVKSKLEYRNQAEFELKDLFSRYATDVTASTAFGLDINSFDDDDKFFKMVQNITTFTNIEALKLAFMTNFPFISKYLKIKLFPKEYTDFCLQLVSDSIKQKKIHNIFRSDLRRTWTELKESKEWTDEEIAAQAVILFFAGNNNIAITLSCAVFEIMRNKAVQEKLIIEVNKLKLEEGESLTYEALSKMNYLDMVITETLRIWPQVAQIDRVCTRPTVIVDPDTKKNINLNVGDSIAIPIVGLHRDPRFFSKPMEFLPERYEKRNKGRLNLNAYMPFGLGQRNCIGIRLAHLEIKMLLYYFCKEFRFHSCCRSTIPLVWDPTKTHGEPKDGFWVNIVQ